MIKYLKPYLKIFFTTFLFSLPVGIPLGCFFLMMGIIFWVSFNGPDLLEGVLVHQNDGLLTVGLVGCLFLPSIVIAGGMALSIGSLHVISASKIPTQEPEKVLETLHTRQIQLHYPYRQAFELCTLSLKTIDRCQIRRTDHSRGTIEAKTGINWKTVGDIISFKIIASDRDRTEVAVSSRPAWHTVIVDYGKNLENVERIAAFLSEKNDQVMNQTEGAS